MTDVLLVAVIVGFFGLAVLFVKGCERIIGSDVDAPLERDEVAA